MSAPIKLQLPSTNPSHTNQIPAFLLKLRNLLDDNTTDELICWNPHNDGESFMLYDQTRFAKEILPLYFKHNNLASFIRQLNMYGFKKITSIEQGGLIARDDMEFQNIYFTRDNPALMERIKRKGAVIREKLSEYGALQPAQVPDVLVEIRDLKDAQDSYSQQLAVIKKENSRLWQDVAKLRFQHSQQQQVINKLLHFMAAVAGKCRSGGKRKLPMLPLGPSSAKIAKGPTLSSTADAPPLQGDELSNSGYSLASSSNNGMTIRDVTDDSPTAWEDQQIIPSTVTTLPNDDSLSNVVITIPESPNPRMFKTQFSDNVQDVQANIDLLKDLFAHSDALDLPTEDLEKLFDGNTDTSYQLPAGLSEAGIAELMQPITDITGNVPDPPMYYNAEKDFEGLMSEFAGGSQEGGLGVLGDLVYPLDTDPDEEDKNATVISSHDLD